MRKKILVVGDLMLDRNWIVAEGAVSAQPHNMISPQRRKEPLFQDSRLGGAGFTAAGLARIRNFEVHLLGSHHPADEATFEYLGLLHKKQTPRLGEIAFHQLNINKINRCTTVKLRIYTQDKNLFSQKFRFDQDDKIDHHDNQSKVDLDQLGDFDAVVISDQLKGCISDLLVSHLSRRYANAWWYVDTKNPRFFNWDLPERNGTLFLNRVEFLDACSKVLGVKAERWEILGSLGGRRRLLELAQALMVAPDFRQWSLVVKLDRDGALACWRSGEDVMVALGAGQKLELDGIGAGDMFLVGWLKASLAEVGGDPTAALEEGLRYGTGWVLASEGDFWSRRTSRSVQRDIALPEDLSEDILRKVEIPTVKPRKLDQKIASTVERLDPISYLLNSIEPREISLRDARLHLGDFLTVDEKFTKEIQRTLTVIRKHNSSARDRRPLNCVVWAPPGSGKTTFAKALAEKLGVHPEFVDLSSFSSRRELIDELSECAFKHRAGGIVVIDELLTPLDGNARAFSSLLLPLWEGRVVSGNRERIFKKPVTFLLVDSFQGDIEPEVTVKTKVDSAKNLLKYISKQEKGRDFCSRINGELVSFPTGQAASLDAVYAICGIIKRKHPTCSKVEMGVIRNLVEMKLSTRKKEHLLEEMEIFDGKLEYIQLQGLTETLAGEWDGPHVLNPADNDRVVLSILD
jgi:hypothetical protein